MKIEEIFMNLFIGETIIKTMKSKIEELYKDKKISKENYEEAINALKIAEAKEIIEAIDKTIK